MHAVGGTTVFVANAQPHKTAGHLLSEERKVLSAHQSRYLMNMVAADQFTSELLNCLPQSVIIDGRRVGIAGERNFRPTLCGSGNLSGRFFNPLLQHLESICVQCPNGSLKLYLFRNHVVCLAAMNGRDADYCRVHRIQFSRHNRLQFGDYFGGRHDRIDTLMRHCCMATSPVDCDI